MSNRRRNLPAHRMVPLGRMMPGAGKPGTGGAPTTPAIITRVWRFYEDGTEIAAVPLAAENVAANLNVLADTDFQIRSQFSELAGNDGLVTDDYSIEFRLNAGAWVEPTGVSTICQMNTLSALTNGAATTNRALPDGLTDPTGTFIAGQQREDGAEVANLQITADNFTENVWALTILAADVADTDTLEFRFTRNGAVIATTAPTPTIDIEQLIPISINNIVLGQEALSQTTLTIPAYTLTAGNNRALYVEGGNEDGSLPQVTGVTFGGVALTFVDQILGAPQNSLSAWALLEADFPVVETQDIVVTWSQLPGAKQAVACTLADGEQIIPTGAQISQLFETNVDPSDLAITPSTNSGIILCGLGLGTALGVQVSAGSSAGMIEQIDAGLGTSQLAFGSLLTADAAAKTCGWDLTLGGTVNRAVQHIVYWPSFAVASVCLEVLGGGVLDVLGGGCLEVLGA